MNSLGCFDFLIKWRLAAVCTLLAACGGPSAAPTSPLPSPAGGARTSAERLPETAPLSSADHATDAQSRPESTTGEGVGAPSSPTLGSATPSDAPPESPAPIAEVPIRGTKVLHIGDSFAGALGIELRELMKAEGVNAILEASDSSYIVDWAHRKNLDKLVWKYNPDLVIVTLGANELAMTEPNQRARAIRKLVEQLGPRPCVWVAIPYWNDQHNTLMDVVKENSAPCYFHDTNQLLDTAKMERIRDGIHPTEEARATWARFFFEWLKKERRPTAEKPWALTAR